MTSHIETKIVVKRTKQISLSDRYTQYQKLHPQPSTVSEIRANMRSAQQASQANRRFAQQLANRPSLQAALGNLNEMSVEQQLGPSNVKARLSHNAVTGAGGQRGGLGRGSGQRGGLERGNSFLRGRGGQGGLRGSPSAGNARGGIFQSSYGDFHGNRGRGRGEVSRGGLDDFGGDLRGRGGNRGRGVERGRGGVRGQSRGRGAKLNISQKYLDYQLDEYMSNRKTKLDKNIDAYIGIPSAGNAREGIFLSPYGDFHGNRGRGREGLLRGGLDGFGGDLRGRGGNRGRGVGRFQSGGKGRVRWQSRGRGANLTISKQQLDSQIDEYMSNRKTKLDKNTR